MKVDLVGSRSGIERSERLALTDRLLVLVAEHNPQVAGGRFPDVLDEQPRVEMLRVEL